MAPRLTTGYWETFYLRELVEEVCQPLDRRLAERGIQLIIDIPAEQTLWADQDLIRRAVQNLVLNCMDAMPKGGMLVATSSDSSRALELEIADSGASLTGQQQQELFQLKSSLARGGTGWALAIVRRIAELHGGGIQVANCPEGGVAFTLNIPHRVAMEAAA
jgi:signal transduction histidine kinase